MNTSALTLSTEDAAALGKLEPATLAAEQSSPSAMIHAGRNLSTSASTTPTPTRYSPTPITGPGSLAERATITFTLDTDILMAAEDQARSTGLDFQEWCQANLNDALRSYLGS